MDLLMYIAPVVVVVIIFSLLKILMIMVKRSMKLKLSLEPEEVDKGAPVRIIVSAEPAKLSYLKSLEGHLICKKFDGYRGSWLERQDIPILSPGVVLSRIKFSYGENIELTPEEENKHVGIIAIPDDAEHTEYRGALQVHWFIKVRAHLGLLPPIILEDELIVLRPVIYSGERLAFEDKKGDTSGADFYDPGFDLEEERMKPVEVLVKKDDDKEDSHEPAFRTEGDSKEKPKIPIAPPPDGKGPFVPGAGKFKESKASSPPVDPFDPRAKLKVQYQTPFTPKANEQVLTDFRDLYRDSSSSGVPQMRAPQTVQFTPGRLPESYPPEEGAPPPVPQESSGEQRQTFNQPWQPYAPQPQDQQQFQAPWESPQDNEPDSEQPQQQFRPPWRPQYGPPQEEIQEEEPAPQGPRFSAPWQQQPQETQRGPSYAPQQSDFGQAPGPWQPEPHDTTEVPREDIPQEGYSGEDLRQDEYAESPPPPTPGVPWTPAEQPSSGSGFQAPWKPKDISAKTGKMPGSPKSFPEDPFAGLPPLTEAGRESQETSGVQAVEPSKPTGIRTKSPFRTGLSAKVDTPTSMEGGRRSTTPLRRKSPAKAPGGGDKGSLTEKPSLSEKPALSEKPTLSGKPALSEKPTLSSKPSMSEKGSFAKLPRKFETKRPDIPAPPKGGPGSPPAGGPKPGKLPLPSMGLKRAPFKKKD